MFDLYNCPNITITDSTFFNNRGTGISRTPFRANSGAVAIGYNNIDTDILKPTFVVTGCNFTSNRATSNSFFRTPNNAVFNGIYSGRGGGIAIYVNESIHDTMGIISDSVFVGNFVRLYGGALFLVVFGEGTQNYLQVENNVFDSNVAMLGGGAIITALFSEGVEGSPHTTLIKDSSFAENVAETGGAALLYLAFEGKRFLITV